MYRLGGALLWAAAAATAAPATAAGPGAAAAAAPASPRPADEQQQAPSPPPPVLTATNFSRGAFAAPAFLTNGFVGLRPGPVPLLADPFAGMPPPLAFDPTVPASVAGFMYRDVSLHVVPAPAVYPFATAVLIDGKDILRAAGAQAVPISQTFDMSSGELTTQLEISSGSESVALNVTMFVSRSAPTVAAMRVTAAITSAAPKGNLTLAPALSLTPACPRTPFQKLNSPLGCSVPAVHYNYTIPDKTMPGCAIFLYFSPLSLYF